MSGFKSLVEMPPIGCWISEFGFQISGELAQRSQMQAWVLQRLCLHRRWVCFAVLSSEARRSGTQARMPVVQVPRRWVCLVVLFQAGRRADPAPRFGQPI